ncbi:MAG TPA: acyl-CoA thioesterase [Candidatus Avacidaminococcus intestinavium]|uniref:Acyl-CoA thioesterase n=1 Tax=Candidatus Avacidaminococcus intestinavium TaxID=2840684 RepID=A0A9D1MPP6_9FIRM|nr:acyl-CoA thioesterase [Candidatus Avacidaminococcus intestinavium]
MIAVKDKVRFVETDMMGVVHHSNYFRWFELGRVAYLKEAGVEILDMMANGYLCPIKDVACTYKNSALFDDEIIIEATMIAFTKVKMVFAYKIIRAKDKVVLAEGQTTNAFTGADGKVKRLPDSYFGKIKRLYDEEQEG